MIYRALVNRPSIKDMMENEFVHHKKRDKKTELEKLELSDDHWEDLVILQTLLRPFQAIQQLLEGNKYTTLSLLPYCVHVGRTMLTDMVGNLDTHGTNPKILLLAEKMMDDYEERWGKFEEGMVYEKDRARGFRNRQVGLPYLAIWAALLDPRLKPSIDATIPELDRIQAWIDIKREVINIALEELDELEEDHGAGWENDKTTPAKQQKPRAINPTINRPKVVAFEMFNELKKKKESSTMNANDDEELTLEMRVKKEIEEYQVMEEWPLQINVDGKDVYSNPLHWWKNKGDQFRYLYKLVARVLAIPATSACSEELFSEAGKTVSAKRSQISPMYVDMLTFLHKNSTEVQWDGVKHSASENLKNSWLLLWVWGWMKKSRQMYPTWM